MVRVSPMYEQSPKGYKGSRLKISWRKEFLAVWVRLQWLRDRSVLGMFEDWQRQGGIADEVKWKIGDQRRRDNMELLLRTLPFFFFFNTLGKTGNPSKIEDLKNGREMLLQLQYVGNYTIREQGWKAETQESIILWQIRPGASERVSFRQVFKNK